MLAPLDVSFLFLLARRRGLCYDSAKANRLRNGEMCQSTQCCKMFLKGCSDRESMERKAVRFYLYQQASLPVMKKD